MKFTANFLPATVALASFMAREADAIYIPDIVRLFRGEGGLTDSVTSNDGTDLSPADPGTLTFPIETPYGGVSRKVFYFDGTEAAIGSPVGLPSGSESRTIVGWVKKQRQDDTIDKRYQFFGYGGDSYAACNVAFGLFFRETTFELDYWCEDENTGLFDTTFDKWFHFAATWDGENNRVYIDGEKRGEAVPGEVPTTNTANAM
jgi:hypothetical protein